MIIVRCANCQRLMRCHSRRTRYVPTLAKSTTTEPGEIEVTAYMFPCPCKGDPAQKREEEPAE